MPKVRLFTGGSAFPLQPRDATAIYRSAHRAVLGAIFTGSPAVNPDPSRDALRGRTLTLTRYLRYKAMAMHLTDGAEPSAVRQFLGDLGTWAAAVDCDGEDDPRVLPLHVFDPDREWADLGTPDGRQRFARVYQTRGRRRDGQGRDWERASALHGRDVLTIAGRALRAGFHWDVQNRGRSATRLSTPEGVWEIGRDAYLNVHPDAHIGGTHRKARRIL